MFKLVVLSAVLAVAAAKPSYGHYAEVPAVGYGVPVGYAAAPAVIAPAVGYAPLAAGAAITKTVHYANTPVVTGYAASVVKPYLGSVATPPFTVTSQQVVAPARSVQTVVPHVTQVEPEVTVQKVAVDVPVHTPVVNEVELRTPVVHAAPAVAAVSYAAAPAVVAAAPAPVAYAAPAVAPAPVAYAAPAVAPAAPVVPVAPVVAAAPAGVVSSYSTKQSSSSSHSSHSSEVEVKQHNIW